jgi:hypothetical protein
MAVRQVLREALEHDKASGTNTLPDVVLLPFTRPRRRPYAIGGASEVQPSDVLNELAGLLERCGTIEVRRSDTLVAPNSTLARLFELKDIETEPRSISRL